jgi:hypothetical protein
MCTGHIVLLELKNIGYDGLGWNIRNACIISVRIPVRRRIH